MERHTVVSHDDWLGARRVLLQEEKEFTQLRDRLNERRRELPWETVDKPYEFDGAAGRQSLSDLFDGRSQLIVYHAMFNPPTTTSTSSPRAVTRMSRNSSGFAVTTSTDRRW